MTTFSIVNNEGIKDITLFSDILWSHYQNDTVYNLTDPNIKCINFNFEDFDNLFKNIEKLILKLNCYSLATIEELMEIAFEYFGSFIGFIYVIHNNPDIDYIEEYENEVDLIAINLLREIAFRILNLTVSKGTEIIDILADKWCLVQHCWNNEFENILEDFHNYVILLTDNINSEVFKIKTKDQKFTIYDISTILLISHKFKNDVFTGIILLETHFMED